MRISRWLHAIYFRFSNDSTTWILDIPMTSYNLYKIFQWHHNRDFWHTYDVISLIQIFQWCHTIYFRHSNDVTTLIIFKPMMSFNSFQIFQWRHFNSEPTWTRTASRRVTTSTSSASFKRGRQSLSCSGTKM